MGMGQPWWYSLPQSGVPSGAVRDRMRAVSMFTSRRLSARPRSVRGPWQIGHTAGTISAAPQEVAVAAQLQDLNVGMVGVPRALFRALLDQRGRMRGRTRQSRFGCTPTRRVISLKQ